MKTIQATDLRLHTREIMESVRWQGAVYQVTTFGQPVAMIVPIELFQKWNELSGTASVATPQVSGTEPIEKTPQD